MIHDKTMIKRLLPHREPFLFLDSLEDVDSPHRGSGFVRLQTSDLRDRPLFDIYLVLVEFAAQASAYVSFFSSFNKDSSLSNRGYLVTIRDFNIKKCVESTGNYADFSVRVSLLKNYKTLYRYFFSVDDYIEGELEFIADI